MSEKNRSKERIQWHPAFCSAMELDLTGANPDADLVFESDHSLNPAPLQIDLLMTRTENSPLRGEIGEFLKRYNLFEFKSHHSQLSVDVYYKAIAYASLFKSYGDTEDAISADDVTITFVRQATPVKLMKYLKTQGMKIKNEHPGIYRIAGPLFKIQFLVTRDLNPDQHLWLSSLCGDLSADRLKLVTQEVTRLGTISQGKEELVNSVFYAIMKANEGFLLSLLKEDKTMPESIREFFHIDELEATIASKDEQIASKDEQIASKDEQIANLHARIAELEEQLRKGA